MDLNNKVCVCVCVCVCICLHMHAQQFSQRRGMVFDDGASDKTERRGREEGGGDWLPETRRQLLLLTEGKA